MKHDIVVKVEKRYFIMKKKGLARIIAFVLTALMVMGMSPVVSFAAGTAGSDQQGTQPKALSTVKYYSPVYKDAGNPASGLEKMEVKSCENYTRITSQVRELTTGWYVFSGYVKRESTSNRYRIMIKGDVNIILEDGCEYQGYAIGVPEDSSLTIYGQSRNTGLLKLFGMEDRTAGIGGIIDSIHSRDNGPITINGGTVNVRVYDEGAGIGGAKEGNGKNITINAGNVIVRQEGSGTAIGGGGGAESHANGTDIVINGGTVSATIEKVYREIEKTEAKQASSAVIGGGPYGYGKNITINGGDITATAVNCGSGAGIGGGASGVGKNIRITGGKVSANGGDKGAGIGGGEDSDGINITIDGGKVYATGGVNGGAGIGGGEGGSAENITINSGVVNADGKGGGAGIGGGEYLRGGGNAKNITISGGKVTAYGGSQAAGIGGGADGGTVNGIQIIGGDVSAYGDQEGAGIGGGKESEAYNILISGTGTKVFAQGGVSGGAGIGGARNRTGADIHIRDNAQVIARAFEKRPKPSAIGGGSDGDSFRIYIYENSIVKADNSYLPQTVVPNDGGEIQRYTHATLCCTVVPKIANDTNTTPKIIEDHGKALVQQKLQVKKLT